MHRGLAVDLGCGSGAQTLALADLGFDPVVAVDTDPTLLAELGFHCADRPAVRAVETDALSSIDGLRSGSVAAVVCMGDTLLHLPSSEAVNEMFARSYDPPTFSGPMTSEELIAAPG
ncbi:MAG: class I SAM-dependent methyltransferase [Acidimicrobiales bacterium]